MEEAAERYWIWVITLDRCGERDEGWVLALRGLSQNFGSTTFQAISFRANLVTSWSFNS